jgi:hypothetical protein
VLGRIRTYGTQSARADGTFLTLYGHRSSLSSGAADKGRFGLVDPWIRTDSRTEGCNVEERSWGLGGGFGLVPPEVLSLSLSPMALLSLSVRRMMGQLPVQGR